MVSAPAPSSLRLNDELRAAITTLMDDPPDLLARLDGWRRQQADIPAGLRELLVLLCPLLRDAFAISDWDQVAADRLLANLTDLFEQRVLPDAPAAFSPDFVTLTGRLRDALRAILADQGLAEVPSERRVELVTDLMVRAAVEVWGRAAARDRQTAETAGRRLAQLERVHAVADGPAAGMDPAPALEIVVRLAQQEPEWDAVLLVRRSRDGAPHLLARAGSEAASQPAAWAVLLEGSHLAAGQPYVLPARDGGGTWLIVPFSGDHAAGALLVFRHTGRAFEPDEVNYAAAFAGQAAGVLAMASLYQQLKRDAASRDHFFSMVNHDLKSPLANIKAQADLLVRRIERGKIELASEEGREEVISRLQQIGQRTRELGRQIDDLVDVARIEAQRFAVYRTRENLADIVQAAVNGVRALYADRTVEVVLPPAPLWVEVDAIRMAQAINNLVVNAIRYSRAPNPIHVRLEARGKWTCVEVTDYGLGIPEEQRVQLFKSYFRGAQRPGSGSGLGLGLYIVAGIVQAHGGTVAVQSEVGVGSTFTICLPRGGAER
ncbi:MAG TPA: hypothetical protein DEP84_35825 [Chloroflexi bacterium]|nr:hypothetical protein [Chloroflexota bacterium]